MSNPLSTLIIFGSSPRKRVPMKIDGISFFSRKKRSKRRWRTRRCGGSNSGYRRL